MVFTDIAFNEPLPELPQATLVYDKTGRHWFWTNYELIEQEDGSWRIHSMTDEGLNALQLPATVLRERIETHKHFLDELKQTYNPDITEEVAPFLLSKPLAYYTNHSLLRYACQAGAARTLIVRGDCRSHVRQHAI